MEPIRFSAALASRGNCYSVDSDGEATVRLSVPASEMPEMLRLIAYGRDVLLRVTVEIAESGEASA